MRQIEERFGFIERFAACFSDHRDPELVEHALTDLLKQRLFGLCLGYEDLNDHDWLRHDAMLAVLVGKEEPEGHHRRQRRDRGKALAGKSTLNRLELTSVGSNGSHRYKKIAAHLQQIHDFLVDAFVLQHTTPPARIVLDLDATDDPIRPRSRPTAVCPPISPSPSSPCTHPQRRSPPQSLRRRQIQPAVRNAGYSLIPKRSCLIRLDNYRGPFYE